MATVKERLLDEIDRIPEDKLTQIYDLIHYFRVGLERERRSRNPTMDLAGAWGEMRESEFEALMGEIRERRERAFSIRGRRR